MQYQHSAWGLIFIFLWSLSWMGDRSRLALVVGLTYQLVQWWHSHEAPFDDHIYTTFITVKAFL